MSCPHNTPPDDYCGRCADAVKRRQEVQCRFCGATEHVSKDVQACPAVKKKKGTEDSATGQGHYQWIDPPPYHYWYSTNEAKEKPAPAKAPPKPRKPTKKKENTT